MTITDFPDWQAPSAHAAQIASQGVPLLSKSNVAYSNTSQSIGGNSHFTSPIIPLNQPGFELEIQVSTNLTSTIPFAEVRLLWIDSASGGLVGTDCWVTPVSNTAPGYWTSGRGMTKADQVQLVVTNLDPTQPITAFMQMLANSRVYPFLKLSVDPIQNANKGVPGWTFGPAQDLPEILAAVSDTAIPASTAKTWLIPPGSGVKAWISVHTGASVITNVRTNLYPVPSSVYGTDPPLIPGLPPAADFSQEFIVPRAPLSLTISNTATSTITASWSLVQQI